MKNIYNNVFSRIVPKTSDEELLRAVLDTKEEKRMSLHFNKNFILVPAAAAALGFGAVAGANFIKAQTPADDLTGITANFAPDRDADSKDEFAEIVDKVLSEKKNENKDPFLALSAGEKFEEMFRSNKFAEHNGISFIDEKGNAYKFPTKAFNYEGNIIDVDEEYEDDDIRVKFDSMLVKGTTGYLLYEVERKDGVDIDNSPTIIGFDGINVHVGEDGEKYAYIGASHKGVIDMNDQSVTLGHTSGNVFTSVAIFDDLDLLEGKPLELTLSVVELAYTSEYRQTQPGMFDKYDETYYPDFTFSVDIPAAVSDVRAVLPEEPVALATDAGYCYVNEVFVTENAFGFMVNEGDLPYRKLLQGSIGVEAVINMKDGSSIVATLFCELHENDMEKMTSYLTGFAADFDYLIDTSEVESVQLGDLTFDFADAVDHYENPFGIEQYGRPAAVNTDADGEY